MTVSEKLTILADSAKYDASCASSGSSRKAGRQWGAKNVSGLCHSWSSDGRCISLLKVLLTNVCIYDCQYCVNRRSNDIPRAVFTPRELAQLTVDFYTRNYVEGLFLSSAVIQTPDHTMELLTQTARLLRLEYRFGGYIHLKLIPGASQALVDRAALFADRVSVNVEFSTAESLALLAPQKEMKDILTPMGAVAQGIEEHKKERKKSARTPAYAPAGQSTQLIIGATPETDRQILHLADSLYQTTKLKRVYYSAYVPVNRLPQAAQTSPPLLREHRLYQADWLMRVYGFRFDELLDGAGASLETEHDPKVSWALRHLDKFPVEVNEASYEQLLRVPGIGIRGASKIVRLRQVRRLRPEDLQRLAVALKRARYFITIGGKYEGGVALRSEAIREKLAPRPKVGDRQMGLFDAPAPDPAESLSAVTGEI